MIIFIHRGSEIGHAKLYELGPDPAAVRRGRK